jgi:acyl-CoA synthetase (AMP-forming)/AMP-acid ligase II
MPVPHGRVGELWVSSPGVAGGYWGRPEETRDAVANYLASGEGPFLSTGDLGFIDGGEVFVTGRRKDLIIIRGRNLYPQDVEAAVAARLAASVCLNGCAAFSLEGEGGERLCLVVEGSRALVLKASRSDPEVEEVLAAIRAAVVREFDVAVSEVAVVRPGTFPRTTSGKVRRQACRAALAAGTLDAIAHYRVAALAVNELDR